ncbi:MAG: hypothetical protein ACXVGC_09815 [Mycobacteriaceae bacterium]
MKRSSRRFGRWWLLVVLCIWPAAAQAKYLHVSQVLPRAERFITRDARYQQATGVQFGHCWHNAPRIVECGYTLDGVTVCDANAAGVVDCTLDFDDHAPVPPSHWLLIAVERRGHLHVHAG